MKGCKYHLLPITMRLIHFFNHISSKAYLSSQNKESRITRFKEKCREWWQNLYYAETAYSGNILS
jgi:hypothetical protein